MTNLQTLTIEDLAERLAELELQISTIQTQRTNIKQTIKNEQHSLKQKQKIIEIEAAQKQKEFEIEQAQTKKTMIIQMRKAGKTLQFIADKTNLSRDRIRQITAKAYREEIKQELLKKKNNLATENHYSLLSTRAKTCLRNHYAYVNNIDKHKIHQLEYPPIDIVRTYTETELRKQPGLGKKTFTEISAWLKLVGG